MKRMSTSVKVAFGYVAMVLLLFVSVTYIYRKMKELQGVEMAERNIYERRRATYQVVSRLYEAEIVGQNVALGQAGSEADYRAAMQSARMAVDSLRTVFTDSLQRLRLDTLCVLLAQKEQNMYLLLRMRNNKKEQATYREQVKQLIAQQDTMISAPQIRKMVVTDNQSYNLPPKKKKRFFQRLAEVFSPPKEDSTEVNKVVQKVYIDTLDQVSYSAADTLVTILKKAEDSVAVVKHEHEGQVRQQKNRVRKNGILLGMQVNRLLETIEEEEQALLNERALREQQVRQNAIWAMALVAVASVLLALVFFLVVWMDITKSTHYRKALEREKNRAEDLLEAREKLMLTITHDIKAPVGSILGYIDLLYRLLQEKRPRFYLDNMRSSARHLLNLVTSLLDFHRLEANKMDVQEVGYNPYQLFETLDTCFQPLAEKKGLELHSELDRALDASFCGDPFRVRQIADNLLSNALKFTEKGRVELRVCREDHRMHLSVADTGCGMTPEEQEKIFQAFTRLKSAQGQEGFGLGLAITQKLVVLLQGDIVLESQPGIGTTFHVYLPLRKDNGHTEVRKLPLDVLERPLRLLMIDDDRIQLHLTRAMIETGHFRHAPFLTCCQQPDELFEALQKERYDLVLTDIQMPAMSGFDLMRQIRYLPIDGVDQLPVVAVSARGDVSEEEFVKQGFAASLHKPFKLDELLAVIHRVLHLEVVETNDIDREPKATEETGTDNTDNELQISALTAFAEGDREASVAIVKTFLSESRNNLERLKQALRDRNIREAGAVAHKMLPTYTLIRAGETKELLAYFEQRRAAEQMQPEEEQKLELLIRKIQWIMEKIEHESSIS